MVADVFFVSNWPQRLWALRRRRRGAGHGVSRGRVGGRGAGHSGGRRSYWYGPGPLWTAAHHRIPMLIMMHDNRLSDTELTDIHAYLASRPAPPSLKDIPPFNQ